jgi:hypothetical protein
MFWRSVVILVILFWLVMATLLLRVTYFPEDSQFAQLPPGAVLQIFLDRGASGKQLHLYHGDRRIGQMILDIRRMPDARQPDDVALLLTGLLQSGELPDIASSLNWSLNINLRAGQRWAGSSGQVRMHELGVLLDFKWREGAPAPEFTLHRKGVLQADHSMLQPFLGQFATTPGANTAQEDFLKVSAREGAMRIAGQKHKGSVIRFSVMDRYRASAFFTEEGDLALIELPDGYRALEPNIHGLVPDELDNSDPDR